MTDPYNSSAAYAAPSTPPRAAALPLTDAMVTTALELPGYRIIRNLGMVRGITVRSRSIVDGSRIVLLHVNGEPCVETQTTDVVHQAGGFRIDGLSIGPLARGDVADDEPRTVLEWTPDVRPAVDVGDELVVTDYGWFRPFAGNRFLTIDRPPPDGHRIAPKRLRLVSERFPSMVTVGSQRFNASTLVPSPSGPNVAPMGRPG